MVRYIIKSELVSKQLITEQDVRAAANKGLRAILLAQGAVVTPAAKDAAGTLGIALTAAPNETSPAGQGPVNPVVHSSTGPSAKTGGMVIALGADHGGFRLKEELRPFLLQAGHTVIDVGTQSDSPCDYPDIAYAVAKLVIDGKADRGIIIDAIGNASAIAANKVQGIRAACCSSEMAARSSREHNDANVLTLGGRVMGGELAKVITAAWLTTWFGGGRHAARLKKITDIERKFM